VPGGDASSRVACRGRHPVSLWVGTLEAGASAPKNMPSQPKFACACSAGIEATGNPSALLLRPVENWPICRDFANPRARIGDQCRIPTVPLPLERAVIRLNVEGSQIQTRQSGELTMKINPSNTSDAMAQYRWSHCCRNHRSGRRDFDGFVRGIRKPSLRPRTDLVRRSGISLLPNFDEISTADAGMCWRGLQWGIPRRTGARLRCVFLARDAGLQYSQLTGADE